MHAHAHVTVREPCLQSQFSLHFSLGSSIELSSLGLRATELSLLRPCKRHGYQERSFVLVYVLYMCVVCVHYCVVVLLLRQGPLTEPGAH